MNPTKILDVLFHKSFSLQVLVHAFYYSQSILKSLAESQMQFGSKSTGYNNQEVFLLSDLLTHNRAVGRSENSGGPVLFGGHNLPPLVEIGLTDLPKSGGPIALPASPGTTPL